MKLLLYCHECSEDIRRPLLVEIEDEGVYRVCGNRGQYQIHGRTLQCVFPVSAESSASGKASTIEEKGEIVGDELHLHHVSYINNFSYDEQYKFTLGSKKGLPDAGM